MESDREPKGSGPFADEGQDEAADGQGEPAWHEGLEVTKATEHLGEGDEPGGRIDLGEAGGTFEEVDPGVERRAEHSGSPEPLGPAEEAEEESSEQKFLDQADNDGGQGG